MYKKEDNEIENLIPPEISPEFFWSEDYTSDFDKVEVKGSVVMTAMEAFPNHSNIMIELLKEEGIDFLFPDNWYPSTAWISFLGKVKSKLSKVILFEMGKKIIEVADFPPMIKTLQDVLISSNVAYHMNYRNGRIGYMKLLEFNEARKYAIIKNHTPSPTDYVKGTLQGVANKFKPPGSFMTTVSLMKMDGEPSKEEGGSTDYFKIKW